jgi:tetratricopeptide (TPR) repeat protein
MKKLLIIPFLLALTVVNTIASDSTYQRIDRMIISGEYRKAVDTCRLLLETDSLNADLWYKMGLAARNLQPDDLSLSSFLKASTIDPANNLYKFNLAKSYLNRNKNFKAKPLLIELCSADSMRWDYANHLTGIYISEGSYDKAIAVYNRFYEADSANYVILDKLGYAHLRKGMFEESVDYYTRSLAINSKNLDAIRNLSFLYPYTHNIDTAITILDGAIEIDPEDIDLRARRGTLNWAKDYNKRALNDYLKILSLGDSSFLYLKRAGIGYLRNMQPNQALFFLMEAHVRDTTDYETIDCIAQCHSRLKDLDKSIAWYQKIIDLLEPMTKQLGVTHLNRGEIQQMNNDYRDAITSYLKGYELTKHPGTLMTIANVYDQQLNNSPRAIQYYKSFLNNYTKKGIYTAEYINSIKERLQYLENKQAEAAAKAAANKPMVSEK